MNRRTLFKALAALLPASWFSKKNEPTSLKFNNDVPPEVRSNVFDCCTISTGSIDSSAFDASCVSVWQCTITAVDSDGKKTVWQWPIVSDRRFIQIEIPTDNKDEA